MAGKLILNDDGTVALSNSGLLNVTDQEGNCDECCDDESTSSSGTTSSSESQSSGVVDCPYTFGPTDFEYFETTFDDTFDFNDDDNLLGQGGTWSCCNSGELNEAWRHRPLESKVFHGIFSNNSQFSDGVIQNGNTRRNSIDKTKWILEIQAAFPADVSGFQTRWTRMQAGFVTLFGVSGEIIDVAPELDPNTANSAFLISDRPVEFARLLNQNFEIQCHDSAGVTYRIEYEWDFSTGQFIRRVFYDGGGISGVVDDSQSFADAGFPDLTPGQLCAVPNVGFEHGEPPGQGAPPGFGQDQMDIFEWKEGWVVP